MKTITLLLFFSTSTQILNAQNWCDNYYLDFETNHCLDQLSIDTVSNPSNIWVIAKPQKQVFTSSRSLPYAILTDSINPYPVNDTSSFIISNTAGYGFTAYHTALLSGYYKVNSDTLNDYGTIEFSPDNGTNWIDLVNDTIYDAYYYWWSEDKPNLTGNSNGWKSFHVELANLTGIFNIELGDTVLYKFSFISDNIQDTLDGLMYDDLGFEDWVESTNELNFQEFNSKIYPNPASDKITLEIDNPNNYSYKFTLLDITGKEIIRLDELRGERIDFGVAT